MILRLPQYWFCQMCIRDRSNAAPIARQIMDFYLNKRLPQIERQENAEKEKKTDQTDLDAPALESQPSENE